MASFGPQVKNMAQRSWGGGRERKPLQQAKGRSGVPSEEPLFYCAPPTLRPPKSRPHSVFGLPLFSPRDSNPRPGPAFAEGVFCIICKSWWSRPSARAPSWPSCAPTVSPLQPPTFPDAGGLGKGGTRGATEPGWAPGAPHRLPGSWACAHSAQTAPCCGDPSPPGAPESPPSPPQLASPLPGRPGSGLQPCPAHWGGPHEWGGAWRRSILLLLFLLPPRHSVLRPGAGCDQGEHCFISGRPSGNSAADRAAQHPVSGCPCQGSPGD